ncbi:hypothetical protein I307_03832 [Cryptococcus deuterogattii 99/473]|uniref:Uncharacterized protein n=2 Tax=Cryptococcus deuterogattii TaxID=1859096 RepID=A0A0D0SXE0_9TREE|nr:hypothetical protein CNBG_1929 [Cryptococcus deuterogattii R265]KIR37847.1 hypothetical protein I313_06214 [Cryptococcus deuterogattii Ram5]KIR70150.1 hypothetical protein I310_06137 [Cryptococcus deuterogattii CA1014]KIY56727.1 hypothetical protein I307_03832 [Cryptococcus deuterogattii 99/473]
MSIRTCTRYRHSSNTWPGSPLIQTNQATDPATNDRRGKSTESKPSKPPTPAPTPTKPSNPLLPDLSRVATAAYTASILAHPPPPTNYGRPGTRPFSLDPLPFTDADVPLPKPYNSKYPHPITAYASPGVNLETVKRSGYDEMLQVIVKEDVKGALGDIFYDAGFRSLSNSVYLLFSYESMGQGNGIPESLWSKFENVNNVRLPTVATVTSSVAAQVEDIPHRFAPSQINSTCSGDVNLHCTMENNRAMERAFRPLSRESLMLRGFASQSPTPDILSPTSSHRSSFSQHPVTPTSVQTPIYAQETTIGYPYNVKASDRRMSAPHSQMGMVAEDELQFGTFNSNLNLGYKRRSDMSSGFPFAYSQGLRAPSSRRRFDLLSPKFTSSPDEEYKDCLFPLSEPKQPSSDFAAISVMSFNSDSLPAKNKQRRLVPQPSNLTLYTWSSSSSTESVGGGSRFSAFEDGLSESLITPTETGWENSYLGSTCGLSNSKFALGIRSSNRGVGDEIGSGAIGMKKGALVKSGSMDSVSAMESPAHSSLSSMVRSKGSTTYEFSSGSSIWS